MLATRPRKGAETGRLRGKMFPVRLFIFWRSAGEGIEMTCRFGSPLREHHPPKEERGLGKGSEKARRKNLNERTFKLQSMIRGDKQHTNQSTLKRPEKKKKKNKNNTGSPPLVPC